MTITLKKKKNPEKKQEQLMLPLFCLAGMRMGKPYYKKVNFLKCILTISQNVYNNEVEEITINFLWLTGILVKPPK